MAVRQHITVNPTILQSPGFFSCVLCVF